MLRFASASACSLTDRSAAEVDLLPDTGRKRGQQASKKETRRIREGDPAGSQLAQAGQSGCHRGRLMGEDRVAVVSSKGMFGPVTKDVLNVRE